MWQGKKGRKAKENDKKEGRLHLPAASWEPLWPIIWSRQSA
jgi:hypothetical protein